MKPYLQFANLSMFVLYQDMWRTCNF